MIITQYSKTTSTSGKEIIIPHPLNIFTSNLLLQRMVVVDQFVHVATSILYKGKPKALYIVGSDLFVNIDCLFNTSDLMDILACKTKDALGFSMGFKA